MRFSTLAVWLQVQRLLVAAEAARKRGKPTFRQRAEILDMEVELGSDLVEHRARNADAAGLGQPLEPRRDVDPVTIDIVAIDDDVAHVDSDPEPDGLVAAVRHVGERPLYLDRVSHRVHGAAGALRLPVQEAGPGRLGLLDALLEAS